MKHEMYHKKTQNNHVKPKTTENCLDTSVPGHLLYGPHNFTLFRRFPVQQISRWRNIKLALQVWMKAPKLIFDCGFEHTMNYHECAATAKQLQFAISANRDHADPFNLHLYNLNPNVNMLSSIFFSYFGQFSIIFCLLNSF